MLNIFNIRDKKSYHMYNISSLKDSRLSKHHLNTNMTQGQRKI
jgi:hypothetical protein